MCGSNCGHVYKTVAALYSGVGQGLPDEALWFKRAFALYCGVEDWFPNKALLLLEKDGCNFSINIIDLARQTAPPFVSRRV